MKKIFSMITLAVLMVALAGSCTKNIEERIDKADTDVAALQAVIGQYEKLQSDITSVIQALRNEVGSRPASEQQTVWECIAALQSQNNTVSAAIGGLKTLVGGESVSGQIDDAVSELISKYNLESLEATLKGLKDEVARKFNVEALKGQVEQLDKTLRKCSNYIARIDAFKGLVQSVSIIPDYDDGSVKVDDGVIKLMCVITPESVLSDISNPYEIFTLTLSYGPATKSGESEEICFDDIQPYDRERGIVLFTANISKYLPEDDSQTLMVSLNVKFSGSNLTSGFAKVTMPERHDMVQLWDGGPYWATCNLGAKNPWNNGDYFAWGQTIGYKPTESTFSHSFNWESYSGKGSFEELSPKPYDEVSKVLLADYDAATNVDESWRTPTATEFKALKDNCYLEWTDDYCGYSVMGIIVYKAKNVGDKGAVNGKSGYTTSDTHIFLPAAGNADGTDLLFFGHGGYWSSSRSIGLQQDAECFSIGNIAGSCTLGSSERYLGYSVRPVRDAE